MTLAGPAPGRDDFLTRTTLQLDEGLSLPSVAGLIKTLQRVPGVLLAEIAAGSARAVVAHDAAVPGASLLAAAARAGVHATIVADTRPPVAPVETAAPPALSRDRRIFALAAALLFLLALGEAVFPRLTSNHYLLPVLLSSLWAFVIARMLFKRRK
ncbi:MAG: hypothetical protein ABSB70_01575 [Candidatus Velthaea sp.]|jgi:hypothetical protein